MLSTWKRRYISMPGRIILVKSYLSALPQYILRATYIPNSIIEKWKAALNPSYREVLQVYIGYPGIICVLRRNKVMGIFSFIFYLALLFFILDHAHFFLLCFSPISGMTNNFQLYEPIKAKCRSCFNSSIDLEIKNLHCNYCFVFECLHGDVLRGRAIPLVLKSKLILSL